MSAPKRLKIDVLHFMMRSSSKRGAREATALNTALGYVEIGLDQLHVHQ
jgi:hypothetical protein